MKSSTVLLLALPLAARAFVAPSRPSARLVGASSLSAKKSKKKRSTSAGEGFGKPSAASTPASSASSTVPSGALTSIEAEESSDSGEYIPIKTLPTVESLNLDPNLSDEERSQAILKQKFGLKSLEEQQADAGDYRAILEAEKKKKTREKLRNIEEMWPEDKDFLAVLPPSLIKGIDSFLKLGLGLCTLAFLAAGVFITIEAGSKATGYELPDGLEEFVVNVVQPNFTPGLGVLLAFSVSLGVFSVALGGSKGSSYREGP